MSRVPCPGCSREVYREALACPHCGVPVLAMLGPRSAGPQPWVIALLVVTGGLGMLMVLGMVAALVIPHLAGAGAGSSSPPEELVDFQEEGLEPAATIPALGMADSAVVRDGIRGLWAAYTLQSEHTEDGVARYAATLEELAGWRDPGSAHYGFAVSAWKGSLCVDAEQKVATAHPLSIDGMGVVYYGRGCRGEALSEYPDREWLRGE